MRSKPPSGGRCLTGSLMMTWATKERVMNIHLEERGYNGISRGGGYYSYDSVERRTAAENHRGAAKKKVHVYVVVDISTPRVMFTGTDHDEAKAVAVEHLEADGYGHVEVVPSGEGKYKDEVLATRDGLGDWTDSTIWILDTEVVL